MLCNVMGLTCAHLNIFQMDSIKHESNHNNTLRPVLGFPDLDGHRHMAIPLSKIVLKCSVIAFYMPQK